MENVPVPPRERLSFGVGEQQRIDGIFRLVGTQPDKRYDRAAECVVREFSALPFSGPPATIGNTTRVISTLPSVD